MAFCVRSERNMDYIKKDKINIGPGQYFKSLDKNQIKKRIHPPFEISSQKGIFNKINDTPGPGSYDLINNKSYTINKDSTFFSTNIQNKEKEKNISTIYNKNYSSIVVNSGLDNNSSKSLDISKYKRNTKNSSIYEISEDTDKYITVNNNYNIQKSDSTLREFQFNTNTNFSDIHNNNEISDYVICDYGVIPIKQSKRKLKKKRAKLLNMPLKIKAGSLQRIISIPSKEMNGYTYGFNKSLNLLIDKTNTNEYIGPGRYDIKLINRPKNILDWSKCLNIKEIKNKNDTKKKNETLEEFKKKGDEIAKIKINRYKNSKLVKANYLSYNSHKGLNDLNTKLFSHNINKKANILEYSKDSRNNFLSDKQEIPGPGYYNNNLFSIKRENEKNKLYLFGAFGSNSNRFLSKSKSMFDIGPTTYFIEKNRYEKIKPDFFSKLKNKRLIDDISNLNKTRNNTEKKISNPGPGTYNLSHTFINRSFSNFQTMDTNNERFNYFKINDNPGPGTYTYINNSLKNIRKYKKYQKLINKSFEEEEKKRSEKIESIKKEKIEGVPGVGTYDIEKIDSISNKIRTKLNPKLSYYSPFLISSGRFKFQFKKLDLPIYDIQNIRDNIKYMAFSKAERFNDINKKITIGPGSYNINKNEQWLKKTFNKLFSS